MIRTLLALAVALALGAVSAGPVGSNDGRPGMATYVGRAQGTGLLIGVVTDGSRMLAYSCDSRSFGTGFAGTLEGGSAKLRARDGAILALRLRAGRVAGTLVVRGRRLAFTAQRARGAAGVYRATGALAGRRTAAVGWVKAPGGVVGVTRITNAATGTVTFQPAPELHVADPTVDVDGTALPVHKVTAPTKELARVWVTDPM